MPFQNVRFVIPTCLVYLFLTASNLISTFGYFSNFALRFDKMLKNIPNHPVKHTPTAIPKKNKSLLIKYLFNAQTVRSVLS